MMPANFEVPSVVDEATRKAQVLIEALPFLQRFHGQVTVVKLGGEPIEDPTILDALLTDLVFLEQVGVCPILVHGGGASISRAMEAAGIEPRWHQGRRITDQATMNIVLHEVEALNLRIVDRLFELGGAAVGLVPSRHCVVNGIIKDRHLELVGKPTGVEQQRLKGLTARGIIPVIPPISVGPSGEFLNTNADDIALAIAAHMQTAKLVFCSNVPGVLRDPTDHESRIPSLFPDDVQTLIAEGVISGGMIPKVQSCMAGLEQGIEKIHIVEAGMPHALLLEIFTREGIGTQMLRAAT